jgi:hypothetical protein
MSTRSTLLVLLCLGCLPVAAYAAATSPSQVTREQVIDEVARFTGLSKDSVSLAVSENPKLLEGLDECVLAVKIVNQFAEAKDAEGLTEIGGWVLGKIKDRLVPAGLGTFLTAVSVYKSALEALRDYTFIPAFESSLYRKYAKARREDARRGDNSRESMTTAFETATTAWFSGYPALKQRMYDRMVKAKGYNPKLIGPELERELWRRIDDYWIACFEARLQQEQLRENRIGIIAKLWSVEGRKLAALRGPSAGRDAREAFFLTEKDLPAGWRQYKRQASDKLMIERDPKWIFLKQAFTIRPANLAEKHFPRGRSTEYRTADGRTAHVIHNHTAIRIYPNLRPWADGTPWYLRDHIRDQLARNDCQSFPGARIVRPFQENGVDAGLVALDTSNSTYPMWAVAFAKGDYYAEVEFHGPPPSEIDRRRAEDARRIREERFRSYYCDAPPLEQMALYFARVVASKMPARR